MDKPRGFGRRFEEWTTTLHEDVHLTLDLLGDERIPPQARRQLAGALSYLLTRLDLIPDHERAGAVDDAMVLRVAYGIAAELLQPLPAAAQAKAGRLMNEEEAVRQFLGDALYAKLRRHVLELAEREVRGRKPERIITDAQARAQLKRELEETLPSLKPPRIDSDAAEAEVERSVMNYLKAKLA